MLRHFFPLILLLLIATIACGDDAATSDIIEITIDNRTGQSVNVAIDAATFQVGPMQEDTVSLQGSDEYDIIVVGAEDGRNYFEETLTTGEIEDLDGRLVITDS